jgi:hypothetical protein
MNEVKVESTMKTLPFMNLEFIKQYKAMRQAQTTAKLRMSTQKEQRRAQSLESFLDARVEAYEREILEALKSMEEA